MSGALLLPGPRKVIPYRSREALAIEMALLERAGGRPPRRLRRGGQVPCESSRLFDMGRNAFATAVVNWTGHTQKAMLLDTTSAGTWLKEITAASNANPVVYTSTAHGFSNNDIVVTGLIGGNLSANQIGLVTGATTNTFSLNTLQNSLPVVGSGAYTSGGFAVDLTQAQFVSDILGNRVGTDVTLSGTSSSRGVMTATSPFQWTAVPAGNPAQAVILYDASGGSDGTNRLETWLDGKISVIVDKAVASTDTIVYVEPVRAGIPNGTSMYFSNGQVLVVNATVNQGDRSITITSAGGAVAAGNTADVIATQAGLPVTPNGGNITFTIGTLYYPTLPTGLMVL